MTSRLRSALLTGAVAATFALGAAPAQADNPQDPAALPAAGQTAPAPNAGTVAKDLAAEVAPAIEAAPATELEPVTEFAPAGTAPADPAPVQAEELLADAVIPVLAPETPANDDGEAPAGGAAESTADVDGAAAGAVDALAEDGVEAPNSASAEEQAAVSGPADLESELAPGTGSDEESAAGSDQVPGTGSEPAPVAGTPAVPTPAATPPPVPAGFEPIVVGGRTLTHADFNIPDDIAASDEETFARWMEDNMDLVLESEGMIYLVDLMMDYLEAGDREGLEALIRELGASDPAAAEDIIRELDGWFQWFEEWPADFGEWPDNFGEWPMDESFSDPATEPAPTVSPASVEVAPASLVPAQMPAERTAAPVAAPSGELAETGASGTIWVASGGAGVLLLGVALIALRRRMA